MCNHKNVIRIMLCLLNSTVVDPSFQTRLTICQCCNFRWRNMEMHDIMINCGRYSLDLSESSSEELNCPVLPLIDRPSKDSHPESKLPNEAQTGTQIIHVNELYVSFEVVFLNI